ncbi:hypothetical protein [Pseudomonas fluorescens]|nr:hypothetical protein [Pseudomonas fluorescens]
MSHVSVHTNSGVGVQSPVGAGLPAMADCQSTLMPDVPAPSLASQLPQG